MNDATTVDLDLAKQHFSICIMDPLPVKMCEPMLTLPTTDYRLPTTDYRLPTTDYRLPTTDYRGFGCF